MLYLLIALPLVFADRDGGQGGSADYKRSNRKNGNPDATVSCVLETDKSGAYRPECQEDTIQCKQGEDCNIQCLGQADKCAGEGKRDCKPCYGTTFIGADGYDLTFTCEGDSACQDVTIQCPDHGDCNIRLSGGNGDAQFGMKGAKIIGAEGKGEMRVENNQLRGGMEGADIQCPANGKCTIMAGEAFKEGYFPGEVIDRTYNVDAYKGANIHASISGGLSVVTEGADRPFQNADIYCPPRERNRGPACDIHMKGGESMLVAMHVHVAESIADVSIECQYEDDAVKECYGDDANSPYGGEDDLMTYKLAFLPTLDCGSRGGIMGNLDFDCVMTLDLDSERGDVFACTNFEGESVCDAPAHMGGFCDWSDDAVDYQRGEDDTRVGSRCDRFGDEESCNDYIDCVWREYEGDSYNGDDVTTTPKPVTTETLIQSTAVTDYAVQQMIAAASVTMGEAFEGNASSTMYLALSLVLFGSSAGVYYACMNKKEVESTRLMFDDDGVTYA